MTAKLLHGKPLATRLKAHLEQDIHRLKKQGKIPYLVSLQVGNNAPSQLFMKRQRKACQKMGILYAHYHMDEKTPQRFLEEEIKSLNHNKTVTGIIIEMPIPENLDAKALYSLMDPKKDVEGMHPENMGLLAMGTPSMVPCTAMAAFELIKSTGVPLEGKEAVVVGHSEIVGKPISLLLLSSMVTTTTCHIATKNLKDHTEKADILVVAVGKPGLITPEMVKQGSMVIDIGINRIEVLDENNDPLLDEQGQVVHKIVGDVSPEVAEVASYMTPVPGGVGPMTIAMLMKNTVTSLTKLETS